MKNNLNSNTQKQKKLKDFNKTLIIHKKRSIFYKIYYKIMTVPFLYKYKRIFKYLTLGLVGTFVDFILLFIFTDILGLFYLFSATISFLSGITANFFLNKKFTFKYVGKKLGAIIKSYLSYVSISLFSLFLTLIFMSFFVEILGLGYMLAKIVISFLLLFTRYSAHSRCFK
jgi:putative flippase GtrA